jgi:hypothetical protein
VALEGIKFGLLSSLTPLQEINEGILDNINSEAILNEDIYNRRLELENNHLERYGRKPTISEKRKIDCEAYADIYSKI